jgi:protein tyrosine/serine phosphatase
MADDELSIPGVRPRRRVGRILIVLVVVLIAGGAYAWQCYLSTYHLATVQPGALYRDGNQSPCQFETAVRKVRPRTVVSLVDDNEVADETKPQFEAEQTFLAKQNIRLERIPVKLGGWPTRADVQRFLDIASNPDNQPVLVHCAQGVRRTGMMVAAYQMKQMGYDKERARSELLSFGHSDRTVSDVKKFIDGYDPATGRVPENYMPSSE